MGYKAISEMKKGKAHAISETHIRHLEAELLAKRRNSSTSITMHWRS